MIAPTAELEIALRRGLESEYNVEVRFTGPEDDADTRRSGSTLPESAFRALDVLDAAKPEYGEQLFKSLFADPHVLAEFHEAMAVTESGDAMLRIRLVIDPASPELHHLRWEALREPGAPTRLFTTERICFSRYISTPVYHPLVRHPKSQLTALVALANPTNLGELKPGGRALAAVDVRGEEQRVRAALGEIPAHMLGRDGDACHVGLQTISDALRAKSYDILYLVCHGMLDGHEPRLYLEQPDGTADAVSGTKLVERIGELRNPPRLVVLASCQSAGEGEARHSADAGVLAALGPRLAEAGVPAVLAMQGDVTMTTVETFMPRFFAALAEDGQIDRAVAVARGATRERLDAWTPVLFMRLKGGGIWYQLGFAADGQTTTIWKALVREIVGGRCTAVLGPGLVDPYVGTRRELAQKLADAYAYPLSPHEREDLTQVAQYVAVEEGKYDVDQEIVARMCDELQGRFRDSLGEDLRTAVVRKQTEEQQAQTYDNLMLQAWRHRCRVAAPEPHQVLAQLPFPLYLSANADNLMQEALEEQPGRTPDVEVYRWNRNLEPLESMFDKTPMYKPSVKQPLVYHLFGKVNVPSSLVTVEDDYFDALISIVERRNFPQAVHNALGNNPLLFVGFQIDDWSFRVIFRVLMNLEVIARVRDFTHVLVQIDPEEQRFENPRAAKRYLDKYLGERSPIRFSIFWGSTQDFMRELLVHYQDYQARAGAWARPVGAPAAAAHV